jgi:hypothetical protein
MNIASLLHTYLALLGDLGSHVWMDGEGEHECCRCWMSQRLLVSQWMPNERGGNLWEAVTVTSSSMPHITTTVISPLIHISVILLIISSLSFYIIRARLLVINMSFSSGLILTDLNDYIAPSQECIKPVEVKKPGGTIGSEQVGRLS